MKSDGARDPVGCDVLTRLALAGRSDEVIHGLDGPSTGRILGFAFGLWALGLAPFILAVTGSEAMSAAPALAYLWLGPVLFAAFVIGQRTAVVPGILPIVAILWVSLLGVVNGFYLASAPVVAVVLCTVFVALMGSRVGPSYFLAVVVGVLVAGLIAEDPELVDRLTLVSLSALFGVVVAGRTSDAARTASRDREALLERLGHESRHDALTGLGNRSLLVEKAAVVLESPGVHRVGLGLIDLDDFKAINDRHGHHVGDNVLQQVGARLVQIAGDNGTAVRIGGDEFAILYVDPAGDASQLARVLQVATAFEFLDEGELIEVRASAGAVIGDRATTTIEDLLRGADLAMYANKRVRRAASELS